jgi:hypothetical protein
MPSFGGEVPSPMIRSSDAQHAGQRSSASPFNRPQQLQQRGQGVKEERELEDNSLAWMAPDFDLAELL